MSLEISILDIVNRGGCHQTLTTVSTNLNNQVKPDELIEILRNSEVSGFIKIEDLDVVGFEKQYYSITDIGRNYLFDYKTKLV